MRKSYDFSNSVSNPYAKHLKEQKKREEILLSTPNMWQRIKAFLLSWFKHKENLTLKTNQRTKSRTL